MHGMMKKFKLVDGFINYGVLTASVKFSIVSIYTEIYHPK